LWTEFQKPWEEMFRQYHWHFPELEGFGFVMGKTEIIICQCIHRDICVDCNKVTSPFCDHFCHKAEHPPWWLEPWQYQYGYI
jgi:hypothetical protein